MFYGGAAGGGKTKALLLDGIRDADRYPGLRVGAFRRTYDELAESFFKELILIDYARAIGCRWHGTDRELRFPNGSVIRFRYLESLQDATRRQGGEYHKVLIDERTMIRPDAVSIIVDERIRSGSALLPVLGVRSASNPGSIGHAACKERYVDATARGLHTYVDRHGRSVRYIPAKVADNPHVDADYVKRLEAIPDEHRRNAMLDGDWDSFAGQYFPEWRQERHVVRPFAIPAEWRRLVGIDWGYAAPWAVLWSAVDNDGRVWVYREIYESEVGEAEQARRILSAEGAINDDGTRRRQPTETVAARMADPSMWGRRGDALPIASVYANAGCSILPADNDRVNGWQRLHTYLAEAPACRLHREMGWSTCPKLHVFDICTELIRTLPALPHDENKVEDVDTDAEDHAPDALRYQLMRLAVPSAAREAKREPVTHAEHLDAYIDRRERQRRNPNPHGL